MPRAIGAYAVVVDDGRVLLGHRTDVDEWELPGGGLEPNEPPWAAAVREVREEVGLDVEVVRLLGVTFQPPHDHLVFDIGCRVVGGTLTPCGEECDEAGWFAADDLPAALRPRHRERVLRYLCAPSVDAELFVQERPAP